MAYYYVKDVNGVDTGTATGDAGRYAAKQTGSFAALTASGYYATIQSVVSATTPPVAGDYVLASDIHDYSVASNITHSGIAQGVIIAAVSDINIDASRRTGNFASESSLSNPARVELCNGAYSGIRLATQNEMRFTSSKISDGILISINSADDILLSISDGDDVYVENTDFQFESNTFGNSRLFSLQGGSTITGVNIRVTGTSQNVMISGGANNGGYGLTILDSDLSLVTGTLIADVGSDFANDNAIAVRFDNCKIATGVAFTNEVFKSYNQRALFTRCSDSTTAAEYQYHLHAFGGDVFDDATIFRNEDAPFTESNQKISYEITTNSDASLAFPLYIDFPLSQYVTLSTTSTLEFYITCATALTDKDVYISVSYTDGTNKNESRNAISSPSTIGGTFDMLATGTALTTDAASTWTGALANLYKIVIDCPSGADCQPTIKVNVTKPSTVLYIASEYGIS